MLPNQVGVPKEMLGKTVWEVLPEGVAPTIKYRQVCCVTLYMVLQTFFSIAFGVVL
jgi:hypothetical protein